MKDEMVGKNPVTLDEKNSIALRVTDEDFEAFCNGEKHVVSVNIDQDTYDSLLENVQGNLILCCEEMPNYYYGCYFWNGGEFPYVVKKDLQYIVLLNGGRKNILRITGHSTSAKQRFVLQEERGYVPDDNGDASMWTIDFEVELTPDGIILPKTMTEPKTKTYLLRWNPAISSFRLDDFRDATTRFPDGFRFNWSVYEWEKAHEGDRFYMLRTGDEYAGIVFRGVFTSEPYPGDDWAGKGRKRYYMEMNCYDCVPADQNPPVSIEELEKAIPAINWRKGHSGELLTEKDAKKLEELWDRMME